MKIETKFSIGDSVWVMREGNPVELLILGIGLYAYSDTVAITEVHPVRTVTFYNFGGNLGDATESECFATKEELLASL